MAEEVVARDVICVQLNSQDVMSLNISKKIRGNKAFPFVKGDFAMVELLPDGSLKISAVVGVAPAEVSE